MTNKAMTTIAINKHSAAVGQDKHVSCALLRPAQVVNCASNDELVAATALSLTLATEAP